MRFDFGRWLTIFSATSVSRSARSINRSTLRLPGNDHSGTLCSPRPRSGNGCASKYWRTYRYSSWYWSGFRLPELTW